MNLFIDQTVNGLSIGAAYALVALGLTMVFGVLRLLHMAHGAVYMLAGFIGYSVAIGLSRDFLPVLAVAMLGGLVLGVVVERIGFYPLRNAPHYAPMISTIGLALVFGEIARLVWGPQRHPFQLALNLGVLRLGAVSISGIRLVVMGCALVLMVCLQVWLTRTQTGRAVRATAMDADAARLIGIPVDRIVLLVFAVASGLAGAAAVLLSSLFGSIDTSIGDSMLVAAFTAALLGGVGNVVGTMLGGLLLGLVGAYAAGYLPPGFSDAAPTLVLLLVLLVRPTGLLGRPETAAA
jgi:branched-chain amino acid transport system permease protein